MLGSQPLSRTTAFAPRRDSRREKPFHQERPAPFVASPNYNPKTPHLVNIVIVPVPLRTHTKLVLLYPTGPLFRNSRGRRWTRSAMDKAAQRARDIAGIDDDRTVPYAVRHQYITDGLARGMPISI